MRRNEFLKNGAILLSLGSIINACTKENVLLAASSENTDDALAACIETPSEVAGPYEIDLIKNSNIYRNDIREDRTGLPLSLSLQVNSISNNCAPVKNARVDIWHCDRDGYYSGFVNDGYLGTIDNTGKTFLRGIQLTNKKGLVNFVSIYPGWYPGRTTHIHLEVFINKVSLKTLQIAFPDRINTKVYTSPDYLGHGQNTTVKSNIDDAVFKDSIAGELCTIDKKSTSGIKASFIISI